MKDVASMKKKNFSAFTSPYISSIMYISDIYVLIVNFLSPNN